MEENRELEEDREVEENGELGENRVEQGRGTTEGKNRRTPFPSFLLFLPAVGTQRRYDASFPPSWQSRLPQKERFPRAQRPAA